MSWGGSKSWANVGFPEIENGDPRNAALSTEQSETFSEANEVNFADRDVLISRTIVRPAEW